MSHVGISGLRAPIKTLLLITACSVSLASAPAPVRGTPPAKPGVTVPDPPPERAVFEARVVDVGRSPGVGSGVFWAYQTVTYRVTKIAKDDSRRLAVGQLVKARYTIFGGGSAPLEDPTYPRLDPKRFAVGATHVVLAQWHPTDEWHESYWGGYDAVPNDAAHHEQLRKLMRYAAGGL